MQKAKPLITKYGETPPLTYYCAFWDRCICTTCKKKSDDYQREWYKHNDCPQRSCPHECWGGGAVKNCESYAPSKDYEEYIIKKCKKIAGMEG